MLILYAILFLVVAVTLCVFAFGGVVIAMSFFTKVLFFLSFICFLISLVLMIIIKIQAKEMEKPR